MEIPMQAWKTLSIALLIAIVFALSGCPNNGAKAPNEGTATAQNGQTADQSPPPGQNAGTDQYLPAENLAKRVVVYKMAYQEGDLAPFTAGPSDLTDIEVPDIAKMLNQFWWDVNFDEASLAPLGSQAITQLERELSQYIAVRMDEADEQGGKWCLLSVGFDPEFFRYRVAEAHPEWTPEQREMMLSGTERGCAQVWCVHINGEWRILAHIDCPDETVRPTPPPSPDYITQPPAEEPSDQSGTDTGETEGEGE
jgi:hypothetical protein